MTNDVTDEKPERCPKCGSKDVDAFSTPCRPNFKLDIDGDMDFDNNGAPIHNGLDDEDCLVTGYCCNDCDWDSIDEEMKNESEETN